MLLHGRTGCDQANGLRVLVCIYLYGVNSEPPLKGCAGRASTYIYGDAAFTSILTHSASGASRFFPLSSKGAISGGCAPMEAFLSSAFLSWAFLSSALHMYTAQRRPLASPLTWNPTQPRSPLGDPSARSRLESVGFLHTLRARAGQQQKHLLCNF